MLPYTTDAQTILDGAVTAAATEIKVAQPHGFPGSGNFRIRIDNEIMLVTEVRGPVWTISRAVQAVGRTQTAAAHSSGAAVTKVLISSNDYFDAAQNVFLGGGGTSVAGDVAGDNGTDNIGIGGGSIDNSTTEPALNAVTTGIGNVCIGASAGRALTTGFYNVAIGESPLGHATTGSYNVALGDYALDALTTANNNVAIGQDAGMFITTGDENIVIGELAGHTLTTGTKNTLVGGEADTTKATLSKGIAIGYKAIVKNDNQAVVGGTGADGVALGWAGTAAPADADITAGQFFVYWDSTNGAAKLKIKGKSADGTVVTGQVALS